MQMRKIQHEALLTEWKQIITTCRGSGLTISKWCRQNNVKESRYYYWLREIRNEALALRGKRQINDGFTVTSGHDILYN